MLLKIGQLKRDPGEYEAFDFLKDLSPDGDDRETVSPLRVQGTVTFGGNQFLLSGLLSAQVRTPCGRCLTPVDQCLTVELNEDFDEAEFPDEDSMMDVGEIAAQVWSASLPMRTLCAEECAGLCPRCGKNLNEGPCDCPAEDIDPRLEVLRSLLYESR